MRKQEGPAADSPTSNSNLCDSRRMRYSDAPLYTVRALAAALQGAAALARTQQPAMRPLTAVAMAACESHHADLAFLRGSATVPLEPAGCARFPLYRLTGADGVS